MASLDEAFRTHQDEQIRPKAPYFGSIYPHSDPDDPTAIPSYTADIRKNARGDLYVDDASWFGTFVLPAGAESGDIVRIPGSRLARIELSSRGRAP